MAKKDEEYDEIFETLDEVNKVKADGDKQMSEYFRRVFSTPDGKVVLHQLLLDLQFFNCKISTEREIALNNYAKFMIFKRLGCNNDKQISDAIFDCRKEN